MEARRVAVLDGDTVRRVDPGTPVFTAFDLAPTRGDGAFESLLVQHGAARKVPAHLTRLAASAARLAIAAPPAAAWEALIAALLAETVEGEAVLKLVLSRGVEGDERCTALATLGPLSAEVLRQRRSGVAVVSLSLGWAADVRCTAPWLLGGVKSLSYAVNLAAVRHAVAVGADDVVFTSADDRVLEGPTSTVVWSSGRTLRTPPTDSGILTGTTQQALFAAAAAVGLGTEVVAATVDDLHAADGLWLVSSVRGAAEVRSLDGRPRPAAELTPLVRELIGIA